MLLVVQLGEALNPLALAAVGAILLWPIRKQRAARAVLLAIGAVVTIYVIRTLAGVLAPFIGVFVLAYLLNPVVCWAKRKWNVPRWASTAVLTALAVGAFAAILLLLVPAFVGQIESLAASALGVVADFPAWVAQTTALDPLEEAGLIERETLVAELSTFLPEQIQAVAGSLPALVGSLTKSVGALIGIVTITALLPVLLYYSLKDYGELRDSVVKLFPRFHGDRLYLTRIANVVGSYLRGQLTISAISAVLVGVPAALFGLPFSLLLGLLAGLLNMVPSLGSILTYVFGISLMLLFGTWGDVLIVLGILAAQAIIEQSLLTPNIMSQQVGLHPVVVMLSLFVFSAFFGLVGFIIAVPVTALLASMVEAYREAFVLDIAADESPLVVTPEAAEPLAGRPCGESLSVAPPDRSRAGLYASGAGGPARFRLSPHPAMRPALLALALLAGCTATAPLAPPPETRLWRRRPTPAASRPSRPRPRAWTSATASSRSTGTPAPARSGWRSPRWTRTSSTSTASSRGWARTTWGWTGASSAASASSASSGSGRRCCWCSPTWTTAPRATTPPRCRPCATPSPKGVTWGFTASAETPTASGGTRVLVDATDFLVRDVHGVARTLRASGQGAFSLDKDRSAPVPDVLKAFPRNTEMEARLTFASEAPGGEVRSVAADPTAVTVRVRHSFVALPEPGYEPRAYDPRAGYFPLQYADYATPIGEPIERRLITRHRLECAPSEDPASGADGLCTPAEPIVYYLDPGTPEPVRSALLDGARWWAEAFTAAGFRDAFRVEVRPDSIDPLDARYSTIQWVHRATRGWSYGSSVIDPRTGEILKGHVLLGSLRVRQDYLIAEGLLAPYEGDDARGFGSEADDPMLQLALARLRQLSAHEVGHTLGLAHNFAASAVGRESVMDYPAPLATVSASGVDVSDAYATGMGAWDVQAIRYGYSPEASALPGILRENQARGLLYLTDEDARPAGAASPTAALWDNGADPVQALRDEMAVRRARARPLRRGRRSAPTGLWRRSRRRSSRSTSATATRWRGRPSSSAA